jgi:protocatechuate 3,4-dioxygenase beta subunit
MAEQHGVRGQVADADGQPVEGLTVEAYDKGLPSSGPRGERLLGEDRTGRDGRFSIDFTGAVPDVPAEARRIHLLVRVLRGGRRLPLLAVVADGRALKGRTSCSGHGR